MLTTMASSLPTSTAFRVVVLLALTGCPGDDVSQVSESDGSTTDPTTAGPSVCIPGQQVACACPGGAEGAQVCAPDGGSLGPCECPEPPGGSTTMEQVDTTAGSTTGEPDTTTGSTTREGSTGSSTTDGPVSGSSTSEGSTTSGEGCNPPCSDDEVCVDGLCEPIICAEIPGIYEPCSLDVACGLGQSCLVDDVAAATLGVCVPSGCVDECECPPGPDGFATSCDDLLGDGVGRCNVPCGGGGPCPDGMQCMFDICMWPIPGDCCTNTGTPGCDDAMCEAIVCLGDASCCDTAWDQSCADAAVLLCPTVCEPPQYGDCINGAACPAGQTCIADAGQTLGWCADVNCVGDAECQPPPPTGTAPAVCGAINDTADACLLDCSAGQTCPDGMSCFAGFACVWNEVPPPPPVAPFYGDCVDNPVATCQPGETSCLTDAGLTGGACSQGCPNAAACPAAPPTGTAPVACQDLDGAGNRCLLDCSGGQACPVGMTCAPVGAGAACLWPESGYVLDETFELGILRPGWTVIDVDGLVPAAAVAFVDDAFVVTDEFEEGTNFGAYSTSWYTPAGQANDWLITPAIALGPDSTLSWEAWAPDPGYPDGYEVRISTTGPSVAGLTANPALFTIADEADVLTPHSVSLAAAGYQNQVVHIGFRNDSLDEFILVIDDIQVTQ